MTPQSNDIEPELWSPLGRLEDDALTESWRQTHYAAQAVAEIGKAWGDPRDDDSHSALRFDPEDETWCALVGADIGPVRGRLDIGSGVVTVDRDAPNEGAWIDPSGLTLDELVRWTRDAGERLCRTPARQESRPAPDLPEHDLGTGGRFTLDDTDALLDLDGLYASTAHLLLRLIAAEGGGVIDGEHELTPRVWPHHFDLASLFVLGRDGDGAMTHTIGVGLTPPDETEASGYWYVSPWRRDADGGAASPSPLEHGRWVSRGDLSMGVLPIESVASLEDPGAQAGVVASFVAHAFTLCREQLRLEH